MNIYYDSSCKQWLADDRGVFFGSSEALLKKASANKNKLLCFHVQQNKTGAGPLIGILAGRREDGAVIGNGLLFKELQKEIVKNGGLSVVFTPQDLKKNAIEGYIFSPKDNRWFSALCPLPHLVFNRIPFRKLEKTQAFFEAFHYFQDKKVPFFNEGFLDKFDIYQLLAADPLLQPFIPETIPVVEQNILYEFLQKHSQTYLKPVHGAKGKGIYKLILEEPGTIRLDGIDENFTFTGFHSFWQEWENIFTEKEYIVQKSIAPALYKGNRFDFRILVHYSKNGYLVTGAGIRQAKKQEITTHLPNGGRLLPYELLQTDAHDQFFKMIAERIGQILLKEKGFFGEFSIDAGLSSSGEYVIYEINSKPMRFDEEEIEKKRLQNLTSLFFDMTGFKRLSQ